MGWTSYHASYYKRDGSVDRKAECDAYFMEGLNAGQFEVLKSVMVGSVYYAAVRNLKRCVGKDEAGNRIYQDVQDAPIWAAVFLTKTDRKDYFNFCYKDMDETMGPYYFNCPLSILKLLSPTDNTSANEWRERCKAEAEQKKSPSALSNLPIGAHIRFMFGNQMTECVKYPPAYQFKRPFWYIPASGNYMPTNRIPSDYEVVGMAN